VHAEGKTSGKVETQSTDEWRFTTLVLIPHLFFTRFPQNEEPAKLRRIQ
jgi:hypothetical protein